MVVLPPATLGILGGGQLGRMLALEAKRMGYRVRVLDPDADAPAAQVADAKVVGSFADPDAGRELSRGCAVVTYEFENIEAEMVARLEAEGVRVLPSSAVLRTCQARLREKRFLRGHGFPVTPFREVGPEEAVEAAVAEAEREVGFPAVLKTGRGGYDGKGQVVVRTAAEAAEAVRHLRNLSNGGALIWERMVPFVKELGVVCARTATGECAVFPVAENEHRENILHLSVVPARVPPAVERRAVEVACGVAEALGVVGLVCVELFLRDDGEVMVNELAPRPHNCGHYTLDACVTSQFEQHLRAVCGLPLGSTRMLPSAAAMVNILGEGRGDRLAGIEEALADGDVKLHLYGKRSAKARRKMGHLTVLAETPDEAAERALAAWRRLSWETGSV